MSVFEPRIIGFLCNWCCYAGADLAGVGRYQYPSNIRVIRVMCSTRVDPPIILEMFMQGADGIFIGGCHLGDCHYITGNYYTQRKMMLTKLLMKKAGFDPERLRLEWVSASEGERFATVISEFTDMIREKGPSPLRGRKPDMKLLASVYASRNAAKDFRLKALVSREIALTEKGNVFGKKITQDRMDEVLNAAMEAEFSRHRILLATMDRPISIREISEYLDIPSPEVLEHIVTLKDRGLVYLDHIEETEPFYMAREGVTH